MRNDEVLQVVQRFPSLTRLNNNNKIATAALLKFFFLAVLALR